MAVFFPQNMLNLEMLELGNAAASFFVKGTKFRTVHPVLTLHLLDHELRIGDDPQAPMTLGDGKFQGRQERRVLSEVIGLLAQVLTQFGQNLASRILDVDAETGRARVAARPTIAISDDRIAGVRE